MTTASVVVRDARAEDADAGAALLRDSIRRLCAADHRDDPAAISAWIANKTAAQFRCWLANPRQSLLVAERDSRLAGVALVGDVGELLLLYVDPDHCSRGVGKALLYAAEKRAAERGALSITLESTLTALRFYEAAGYSATEQGDLRREKRLSAE